MGGDEGMVGRRVMGWLGSVGLVWNGGKGLRKRCICLLAYIIVFLRIWLYQTYGKESKTFLQVLRSSQVFRKPVHYSRFSVPLFVCL